MELFWEENILNKGRKWIKNYSFWEKRQKRRLCIFIPVA